MKMDELKSWLGSQDGWDFQLDDKGIVIRNDRFETLTHATFEAVEGNTLEAITASCSQGKVTELSRSSRSQVIPAMLGMARRISANTCSAPL